MLTQNLENNGRERNTESASTKGSRRPLRVAAILAAGLLLAPYVLRADEADPAEMPDGEPAVEQTAGDSAGQAPVSPVGYFADTPALPAVPATLPATATPDAAPAVLPATPVVAPAPATRPANADSLFANLPEDGRVNLLVGQSLVLKTKSPYKRISLTQPEILADNAIDPTSILLTAKKAGTTQLVVWDDADRSEVVSVNIDVDLNALSELVKKNFPNADVELSAANGTVVARGRVPTLQTAEQISELLSAYGKVLNFLELAGGQQVMLQVRFAEVSRSATTALGVNFGFADGAGHFGNNVPGGGPFQVTEGVGDLQRAVGANVTLFGGGRIGSTAFDVFVSALRNNNLLRVLAEPNLSTVSGKEAEFLAGGEFPIPVPQAGQGGNAAITVEYKQFGVRLTFVPVVLGDGKIRLQGTAEVSDLDFTRSVAIGGFSIPSITKRTVTTTIELHEGQTFAVAGLLNNRITATKQAVPLLGDIPVLGALFRSVRYERNETELVVLVTPRLVEAMNPKQVPELPGERWVHPSESDLFLRQYLGGPGTDPAAANKPGPAMYRGPYGFVPVRPPAASTRDAGQRVSGLSDEIVAE